MYFLMFKADIHNIMTSIKNLTTLLNTDENTLSSNLSLFQI